MTMGADLSLPMEFGSDKWRQICHYRWDLVVTRLSGDRSVTTEGIWL